ncbi:homocitrate synthase [Thermosporothrix hazakensis]|jgi:homocitrate synthase|uniref:Homocitrate synthase n=2 Tax=Thermosporothrix TaxID=768650 RepID=A0A326U242_THEHA|nr:homocitrate synthase [Thermosporothrix hazakensis]PZW25378.1 homocitrate synthase [Thermosporothrix hazakensis]BBH90711.1 homocitrate synthase [Thermosporothrix sp. COM3]GCE48762.1 homocitrate synthase [Thermosporothrix hazakensis]
MRTLHVLDTTLREGEQLTGAYFTLEQRVQIARLLDAVGVSFIEVPSPIASAETRRAVQEICGLQLRARVVAHVRCAEADVQAALETGVDGLNLFYGTSPELRSFSHGKRIEQIISDAVPLIRQIRAAGRYVRFSAEDAFRSDLVDLLTTFDAVVEAGAQRIGLPDTVGVATPRQVESLVRLCAERYPGVGIEFHGHNDTGCAVANTVAAFEGGADCLDVTVLGIGERNGIASLSGLIAQLYIHYPERLATYDLTRLPEVDRYVAECLHLSIPFNNPITAPGAFTHRAGIHTKAVLRNPRAYEILDPQDFGLARNVEVGSRYTGRYAVGHRAAALGIELNADEIVHLTQALKERADTGAMSQDEVDTFILNWYQEKGNLVWER